MDDDMLAFATQIQDWHTGRVEHIREVVAQVKDGVVIAINGQDEDGITASSRDALFFQLGAEAVLAEIGKLPFSIAEQVPNATEFSGRG